MSETTNYKLHLSDDSTENFIDWRQKLNGTDDSNMMKIDAALGEKANSSVAIYTTLLASKWTGVSAPFMQEIRIDGMTADQNGMIDITHSATTEQREVAREAIFYIAGQSDGILTVAADGEMPEVDIPVCVILLG